MASYFELELDTTPPQLTIIAPNYTIIGLDTDITIESNEALSSYQDIYIIDSLGVKHNRTFLKVDENTFQETINFSNIAHGIATIYCRLKDESDNMSSIYSKTINVLFENENTVIMTSAVGKCALTTKIGRVGMGNMSNKIIIKEEVIVV